MSNLASYPFPLAKLRTPAFCVDRARVVRNCERMLKTAEELGVQLRPHMKTHKTIEGGILMTGGTKRKIVVSTLAEAEFFADNGFDDILYGYPLIPAHIPRCLELAKKLDQFHVMTDNRVTVDALSTGHNEKGWSVLLAIDCGNGREGIHWENIDEGISLAKMLLENKNTRFSGIYAHCGNSYHTTPTGNIKAEDVARQSIQRILQFAHRLKKETGIECPIIGIGSTPSCSHAISEMKQLTELHPGNYIFFDSQQYSLGSCRLDDIACTVVTRIIGHYPDRNELLIDCGFAALTKQGMGESPSGCVIFADHPNLKLIQMTQEIGKVTTVTGDILNWEKYLIGTMLFMYPWHSCATSALHPNYHIIENGRVMDKWMPCRGW